MKFHETGWALFPREAVARWAMERLGYIHWLGSLCGSCKSEVSEQVRTRKLKDLRYGVATYTGWLNIR
jgi:hypothetical protein